MRQITFRAKDIENDQQWRYGSLINYPNGNHVIVTFDKDGKELSYDVNPDTLGQYTGLKDRNGKDIYEGDIVDWDFYTYGCQGASHYVVRGFIRWWQGGFILDIIKNDFDAAGYYAISDMNTDTESDTEVLGNIHDNPELFKGGEL